MMKFMSDDKKPTDKEKQAAAKKMLADFDQGFADAMGKDREDLEKAPKTHDPSKGEFVEEIDPALADK